MLRFMLNDYRHRFPNHTRSDTELLTNLMEYLVEEGRIKNKTASTFQAKLFMTPNPSLRRTFLLRGANRRA